MIKKQKANAHRARAAHTAARLGRPHHPGYLMAHQKNVMSQHQFLEAQNAINHALDYQRWASYTGNPYLRY